MSGFEVIVRPVVFPNIRPAPSRSLPPEDDPEAGRFIFGGSNGQVIALNHSFSASGSGTGGDETDRTYDVARISESGSISGGDSAYIDVEVLKHVKMRGADGSTSSWSYTPIQEAGNITIIQRDVTRKS